LSVDDTDDHIANQPIFETIISAIEHFARDPNDVTTARTAIALLTKMVTVWGGPDIPLPPSTNGVQAPTSTTLIPAQPALPGFDTFAISRFSPLSWTIPMTPGFRITDPTSRNLVQDIAGLQQEILKKTGAAYLAALEQELRTMGAGDQDAGLYLEKLRGDAKSFKDFLVGFLGRGS
jgi:exportin-T